MRMILLAAVVCVLAAPARMSERLEARETEQNKTAGAHANPRPPSNWWKTAKYIQELKLTPAQSSEIEQIVQTSMARLRVDKDDLDRAQSDFRSMMEESHTPQRELLKAAERLEMARFSISKERTSMLVRIHSVLTPDQRRGLDVIAKREAERTHK